MVYFPQISEEGLISEKRNSFNPLLNKIGIDGFKVIFIIITTILPLILGYAIKYDSDISIIISKMAFGLGVIVYYSCIIRYHYIFIDHDKLSFSNSLFIILSIFLFITVLYPDIFSDFLKNLPDNLLNIAVTSLTFVLLTATLALLVFTYDMFLKRGDYLYSGKYYFKSTVYAIFSSIMLFVLFVVLVLFKINWDSAVTMTLFIEINVIGLIVFFLAYFIARFLDEFIKATIGSLVMLDIR